MRIGTWPWQRAGKIALKILAAIVAVPIVYLAVALILGLVPANVRWSQPEQGVTIFLRSNGVHTWIMMPKLAEGVDWHPYAPPDHLADPRYGQGDHVAIGYGNRDFYLNTPTWADLTVRNALAAAFGNGPALLHVEHAHAPAADEWQRPLIVRPDEYRRLAGYIQARFRRDDQNRIMPLIGRGYGPADMFYEAHGGYSFVLTCNEWTGRALRHAGIRTGLWTPLEQSIMWRLD